MLQVECLKTKKSCWRMSLTRASKAAACIVEKGIEKAMNEYNIKAKKEKKKSSSEETAEKEK